MQKASQPTNRADSFFSLLTADKIKANKIDDLFKGVFPPGKLEQICYSTHKEHRTNDKRYNWFRKEN